MQNLRRIILRIINIVKLSLDGYALHCTMIISSATPKSPNELERLLCLESFFTFIRVAYPSPSSSDRR